MATARNVGWPSRIISSIVIIKKSPLNTVFHHVSLTQKVSKVKKLSSIIVFLKKIVMILKDWLKLLYSLIF
ncbi:hypothetical protein G15_3501 [Enterococcus avium]|nr:hypothetical protein G15_3501 [Enterococcus avium]